MIFETVEFFNSDESFSHFSVICIDSDGVLELPTCIMHETRRSDREYSTQEISTCRPTYQCHPSKPTLYHYSTRNDSIGKMQRGGTQHKESM